jgi:hypothetical protein
MSSCRCPECKQIIDARDRVCPQCEADIHVFCDAGRRHAVTGWLLAAGALALFVILSAPGQGGAKLDNGLFLFDAAPHAFAAQPTPRRIARFPETATRETSEAVKAMTATPTSRARTRTNASVRTVSRAGAPIALR